jgi:hypothetical protein
VVCYSQVSPPKTYIHLSSVRATCPTHLILLDSITRISVSTYIITWRERIISVTLMAVRCGWGEWQTQWMYSIYGCTKYWEWLPLTCDRKHARYRLKLKDLIFETSRPTVWETSLRMATEALQRRRERLQVTHGPKFLRSRDSSVTTVTELRTAQPMNQASIPGKENKFLTSTASRAILGHIQVDCFRNMMAHGDAREEK